MAVITMPCSWFICGSKRDPGWPNNGLTREIGIGSPMYYVDLLSNIINRLFTVISDIMHNVVYFCNHSFRNKF